MVALVTGEAHVFKQCLLEGAQLNFDRAQERQVIRGQGTGAASALPGVI